jgi:hypothetical protein
VESSAGAQRADACQLTEARIVHWGDIVRQRVWSYIEGRIVGLGYAFDVAVIGVWAIGRFVPEVRQWIVDVGLFDLILVVLLVEAVTLLVQLKAPAPPTLRVYENQLDAMPDLIEYVRTHRPKTADLIEYSAATIGDLLAELRAVNCRVRLLVEHPSRAPTEWQRERIDESLKNLRDVIFAGYSNTVIRCYCAPGGIRGRSFGGEFVCLGWYTYHGGETITDRNLGLPSMPLREIMVLGHVNALIAGPIASQGAHELLLTFDRAFAALWTHPETVPVSDVVPGAGHLSHVPRLPWFLRLRFPHRGRTARP